MRKEVRMKLEIPVPKDIRDLATAFKAAGFKLFLVGGAVRDAILGQKPKDFDLATDALPDDVERIAQSIGKRTLGTGKAFGVINVFTPTGDFEIATFRKDIGSGRRPDSVEFSTIEVDVNRRDATMNGLFFDLDTNEVVDLVGGIEDLMVGVVRAIGDPSERIKEDRLRIMRFVRFAAKFEILHSETEVALFEDASLEGVSAERIKDEFFKGIASAKSVKRFMQLLDKFKLFDFIFKGMTVKKDFMESRDPMIVIAACLRENQAGLVSKQLNKLTFKVDEIRTIKFLINLQGLRASTAVRLKRDQAIAKVTEEQILTFRNKADIDVALVTAFLNFELSVKAESVKASFGLEDGPALGAKIEELEILNFRNIL